MLTIKTAFVAVWGFQIPAHPERNRPTRAPCVSEPLVYIGARGRVGVRPPSPLHQAMVVARATSTTRAGGTESRRRSPSVAPLPHHPAHIRWGTMSFAGGLLRWLEPRWFEPPRPWTGSIMMRLSLIGIIDRALWITSSGGQSRIRCPHVNTRCHSGTETQQHMPAV